MLTLSHKNDVLSTINKSSRNFFLTYLISLISFSYHVIVWVWLFLSLRETRVYLICLVYKNKKKFKRRRYSPAMIQESRMQIQKLSNAVILININFFVIDCSFRRAGRRCRQASVPRELSMDCSSSICPRRPSGTRGARGTCHHCLL